MEIKEYSDARINGIIYFNCRGYLVETMFSTCVKIPSAHHREEDTKEQLSSPPSLLPLSLVTASADT